MSVVLETHVNRGKYINEFNSLAQQEQPMRYVKDLETYIANEHSNVNTYDTRCDYTFCISQNYHRGRQHDAPIINIINEIFGRVCKRANEGSERDFRGASKNNTFGKNKEALGF